MKLKTIYEKSQAAKTYEEFLRLLAEELKIPDEYDNKESYVEFMIEKRLNSA